MLFRNWTYHRIIFTCPIGQVGCRFHLPKDAFHLPRAIGQPLMSNPEMIHFFNDNFKSHGQLILQWNVGPQWYKVVRRYVNPFIMKNKWMNCSLYLLTKWYTLYHCGLSPTYSITEVTTHLTSHWLIIFSIRVSSLLLTISLGEIKGEMYKLLITNHIISHIHEYTSSKNWFFYLVVWFLYFCCSFLHIL